VTTITRSIHDTISQCSKVAKAQWSAAKGYVQQDRCDQLALPSELADRLPGGHDIFKSVVRILPAETVKRHIIGYRGLVTESIYAPAQRRIEFLYNAPVHLLVLYIEGARRDGETSIADLSPSRLRNFANKLTFVPAGYAYKEWHETRTPTRIVYLYLSPDMLQKFGENGTAYAPKVFFEDTIVWETATKLQNAIASGRSENQVYAQALTNVLAHELLRSGQDMSRSSSVNRGGLATWQMRIVTQYIEEHLEEQISLTTLAGLVRLSQSHFCRAFKQSFGVPPHEYHVQQRIERAKTLLVDQEASVTDVGFALGYSHTSSFSVAFRKITGRSPSEFRRYFA
jgi:AraC family transcriptional regulator